MPNRYLVFGLMILFLSVIAGCSSQSDSRSQMPKPAEDEPGIQTKIFNLKWIRLSAINDKQDNPDFQSLAPKRAQDFIDTPAGHFPPEEIDQNTALPRNNRDFVTTSQSVMN